MPKEQILKPGFNIRSILEDFPGGPVVKNPSANTVDVGSVPGRGTKIPHALGQLSPCAAFFAHDYLAHRTIELACSRAHAAQQEKPVDCNNSLHATTKTQCRQNKNK